MMDSAQDLQRKTGQNVGVLSENQSYLANTATVERGS